jgi:[ribosomal protein S5]-alanine N-acetyltransferase
MQTLCAGSLRLEPQLAAHAREMFSVLSDPAIYEFENEPPPSEKYLFERFTKLESRRSGDGTEQWLNWVIRLPSNELAGYVQATVTASSRAYVAYELASRFWRQGIGRAAVTLMLDELRSAYGVNDFYAVLKARNFRSEALLIALGFSRVTDPAQFEIEFEADEIVMHRQALP